MTHQESSPHPALFTGDITPEMRQRLRQRRRLLGITLQQLAVTLRVNWSTLRKWEDGSTRHCHIKHINRLNNFLSGQFDLELQSLNAPLPETLLPSTSTSMLKCLEKAASLYTLCGKHPDLQSELLHLFRRNLAEAARRLVRRSNSVTSIEN